MAAKSDGEPNACTFLWKIENINYCWMQCGEVLKSPVFIADGVEGTAWSLWLYPMGLTSEHFVRFYLHRENNCRGPNLVKVNYEFAFQDKEDSVLSKKDSKCRFEKGFKCCVLSEFRRKVFYTEKETFLPDDTLTVYGTIWKKGETPVNPYHISARTVLKVNRRNFVCKIDKFNCFTPFIYKFKDDIITFNLIFNETDGVVKKLDINIISFQEPVKIFSFNISVINSEGEKEECGTYQYSACDLRKGVLSMPLFAKMLIENKRRCLPNGKLLLDCEYVSSNGTISHEFWNCRMVSPKVTKMVVKKEKSPNPPVLIESLKSMFNDRILSDIELRTSTQTFSAHKAILGARSPVFRRMFSQDMKEKNSGHVDITDLDDDTVHRMLLYVYTDSLEDLELDNARNLFTAADKYEILSLKSRCSSFLKNNLTPTKACDILLLADRHQDDDLKTAVEDFILRYVREVFGSQEWKDFMATNSQLAAGVMYRKFVPC